MWTNAAATGPDGDLYDERFVIRLWYSDAPPILHHFHIRVWAAMSAQHSRGREPAGFGVICYHDLS